MGFSVNVASKTNYREMKQLKITVLIIKEISCQKKRDGLRVYLNKAVLSGISTRQMLFPPIPKAPI